eukprot:2917627-Prymnesium_polylepis.1
MLVDGDEYAGAETTTIPPRDRDLMLAKSAQLERVGKKGGFTRAKQPNVDGVTTTLWLDVKRPSTVPHGASRPSSYFIQARKRGGSTQTLGPFQSIPCDMPVRARLDARRCA